MVDFEKRPITVKAGLRLSLGGVGPGAVFGLLLVLLGTLLFIDNLNILPFSVAGAFWPLSVLLACAMMFYRTCSPVVKVWAVTGMVWGLLMLLDDFNIIHVRGAIFWPLALIACGIILLMFRLRLQAFPWDEFRGRWVIGSNARSRTVNSKLEECVIFSGVKRKIETINFEGGELTAVFGSIEIDLRRASISTPDRMANIEANSAFGSIELRIPETWQVQLHGNAVFGAYEDKTIPPRPDPGSPIPTLIISGGTAFGAVVIKS
ncbi:MAG: hypothetical protein KGN84_04980 [Acidobacteriota bacterium]|nr:hypothetical protein [Acidobacteriota bacterium]